MEIITFDDAVSFYSFAASMRHDLPDGQWEELREMVGEYMADYGRNVKSWPENAKQCFTEEVKENYITWM